VQCIKMEAFYGIIRLRRADAYGEFGIDTMGSKETFADGRE